MKKRSKREQDLTIKNPHAAGIDIGSSVHYVAVSEKIDTKPIREFGANTEDLALIVDWLKSLRITTVAMESTGIYWIPLYDMLESKGIEVCLVNARHLKNVSGRKTDVSDSEWLRRLHTYGLLNNSFIPDELTRELRIYVRQREAMETLKAKDLTKIGSALHAMNIKLQNIVSSLDGETSMKILRLIIGGEHSPEALVSHWTKQMKATIEEARSSLAGNYKEENLFILSQALSSYDFHKSQMLECESRIEKVLKQMCSQSDKSVGVEIKADAVGHKKKRKARKNEYHFDAVEDLKKLTGVDLTAIDGFGVNTVLALIAETGTDMSKFKTSSHFSSWLRLCPNPSISGGKILGYRKSTSSSRAAKAFRLAAQSLHSHKGYWGHKFRAIAYKKGTGVAIKAIAHKLAVVYYTMLRDGKEYRKEDMEVLKRKNEQAMVKNLENKAKKLGFNIVKVAA
jgi:transposase